jgi:hypothetical protein
MHHGKALKFRILAGYKSLYKISYPFSIAVKVEKVGSKDTHHHGT